MATESELVKQDSKEFREAEALFFEQNKDWLDKFDFNDYGENFYAAWWSGQRDEWDHEDNFYFVPDEDVSFSLSYKRKEFCLKEIDPFFLDWKNPTKEENDYFEMINGFRIPWGEGLLYHSYGEPNDGL